MVSEALAGLSAFKTMFDLAKGLKDINDATVRNSTALELQEKILSAQQQQAALVAQVSELEAQVAKLKTWEAEKQRYELTDFGGSTFAYVLKSDMARGEPAHRLCAACYQNGQKSILQFDGHDTYSRGICRCPACKTEFRLGEKKPPPHLPRRAIRVI